MLADKLRRTDADARILTALIRAEAAAERAQRARAQAARIVAENEEAVRILEANNREEACSEREQELYNTAELLVLAGLVDSETYAQAFDRRELLGALLELANVPAQIILPNRHIDKPSVRSASRGTWGALPEAGAEIYEFQPPMFHCKVLIVDELWVSVG